MVTESEWAAYKIKFPKGAQVQLISGGPTMTVNGYGDESLLDLKNTHHQQQITCQWFSGKKLEHGRFAPEALMSVQKNDKEKQSS